MPKFRIIVCIAERLGFLSKPFIEHGVGKGVRATFRNLAKSVVYCILIKIRPFALESTNVEV